jgi:RimJ/RimL family protein N-acetyltransferase
LAGSDLSPVLQLRLATPRLELRLPGHEELIQLGRVAAQGVHPPEQMPFLVPWTDAIGSPSFIDEFVRYHRELRARWRPDDWCLELGVWADGSLVGVQAIHAKHFPRERTVYTGSWLGRSSQGNGYGTEMRAAVLELAFSGLGAVAAGSGALEGNAPSARVSAKLGYTTAGERWPLLRGEPVRERRYVLRRERWNVVTRPPIEIDGLEPCLPLFGVVVGR